MPGGHLYGTTGDRGQANVAGRDINHNMVNNIRGTGWIVLAVMIAAVTVAVAGYVVAREVGGDSGRGSSASPGDGAVDDPASGDGAAGGSEAETSPGPGPRSSPPQHTPDEPAERWRGTLTVDTDGAELDSPRPGKGSFLASDIALGQLSGWQAINSSGGTIALWQDPEREPGHADCDEATQSDGSYMAPVRQDAVLCVRTNEGRIARLRVTEFRQDFVIALKFDVVVWELSASQGG
ncbi:MAG TPA: hypothetical protein VE546_17420 [Streptomyces sp.]|uniref:hypothetical protein n=1 Tax=Streptomyces sp. TaxID=1931 RepID=UPI002D275DFB|nr:hypothetical protein [Streptomyces sp.]HZG05322.1 hypothetical protein [Streptomyces sp.]